ncbi:MAG: hypothetical protein GFH27_549311n143 [Chloroflexi bacterium AL-W]|nr:hypothetical protein [Chloroflexi bacterium AL-N1]NOK68679.1 hypothetical protein [Chloroflexi bacterium AL-N10]NOK76165.1 hypothetical protein [Chloroflexi bacterium AL-N5]NOK84198.1 hypothetical protein [Chloroflexi bacterium AL-W]NOK91303.1 hypothetical protein [Chloroflexi bacterium AL-N15]
MYTPSHQPNQHPDRTTPMVEHLRRSPATRGLIYIMTVMVYMYVISRSIKRTTSYRGVKVHALGLPFTIALTYMLVRLTPEERMQQPYMPTREDIPRLLQGMGLGTAAFLTYMSMLKAKGWGELSGWGWEETSPAAVGESLVVNGLGDLAVACNEELVFRGYGFDTLRQAYGTGPAATFMIALFALIHRWTWLSFVGHSAAGLALTVMRLRTGTIWMSVGYHWFWNYIQLGVFGAADLAPSVRPLRVHGPRRWTGRPGHPDPGLLSMCIHLSVALAFGLSWWRQQRRKR